MMTKDKFDNHPSGITDEGELSYVSLMFWGLPCNANLSRDEAGNWNEPAVWERLLSFQQGWKSCMEFYEINT